MGRRASAPNWEYGHFYQLSAHAPEGEHHVLFFHHMQLSFADSNGGCLLSVASPEGTVSVAAVTLCPQSAYFGYTKFKENDIVIFDDSEPRILFIPEHHRLSIVSFSKKRYRKLAKYYGTYSDHIIDNAAHTIAPILESFLQEIRNDHRLIDDDTFVTACETRIAETLETLTKTYHPYFPKLTKGEKIALEIRDRVYDNIEPDIAINNFAKEYGVTEQTLQNAFKSLFGMTPHKFLRNLKLNHVRHELLAADPSQTTVVAVANRWGFTHMGHFSGYYTRLFGENPSVTLQRGFEHAPKRKRA
jgi:AraC-like DNA-binding protein